MKYLRLFIEQLKYSWIKKFSLQLTTLLVLMGSFLAVSLTLLFLTNFNTTVNSFGEKFEVSVYLTDQNIKENKGKISKLINESGLFKEVNFIHKDSALKTFKSKMKKNMPSFILEEKSINPLPSSYSLKIKKDFNSKAGFNKISKFADQLMGEEGVDEVAYGQVWASKYTSFLKTYKLLSVGIVLFLVLSIILIIGNSIKSSISQRRREIEVLELVGATRMYIRLPFIMEGAFMGFLGAACSIFVTYAAYSWIVTIAKSNMGVLLNGIDLHFLSIGLCVAICLLGVLVGSLGATICINKMNSGWAASNG